MKLLKLTDTQQTISSDLKPMRDITVRIDLEAVTDSLALRGEIETKARLWDSFDQILAEAKIGVERNWA